MAPAFLLGVPMTETVALGVVAPPPANARRLRSVVVRMGIVRGSEFAV